MRDDGPCIEVENWTLTIDGEVDRDSEQPLASRSRTGNPIGYCNNVARRVRGRVI